MGLDRQTTLLRTLIEFDEQLQDEGIILWSVALNEEPLHMVRHSPFGAALGRDLMFVNLEQAVQAYGDRYHVR